MKTLAIASLVAALALSSAASAEEKAAAPAMSKEQQEMMAAFERMGAVRPEHKQLDYFVGDWKATTTMWMDPKAPPQKSEGKSHAEQVMGGRYVEVRHEGDMNGQKFEGRGVVGYDNIGGRYFSTWMDSMSTGFWLAYGTYDKASNSYTFKGSMDDPMKAGTKVSVREVMRVVDPKHYVFEWYETRGGGKEAKTMQVEYTKL